MTLTTDHPSSAVHHPDDARLHLEAQLVLRDAMLQAISYAAQRFLGADALEDSVPRVLERLGIAADVSLVYLFETQGGPGGEHEVTLRYEWVAPSGAGERDTQPMARFKLGEVGLGRWEELLRRGEAIYGHARLMPASERAVLEASGVRSIAVVPIVTGGEWLGHIGFSVLGREREWSAGEVGALKAAAGIIGAAVVRRRMDEALRQHAAQEQIILAQQAALQELSTPLMAISDSAVVMPLVGAIDSARAQQVIETLLEGVAAQRARVAIIDITGVSVVDTQVANALIRAAQAVKLLGANVVLTGIRPEIAQTLVGLGVDLGGLTTRSTLQAGIAFAMEQR
jgi:rsbT co-antagonist protein RsbR